MKEFMCVFEVLLYMRRQEQRKSRIQWIFFKWLDVSQPFHFYFKVARMEEFSNGQKRCSGYLVLAPGTKSPMKYYDGDVHQIPQKPLFKEHPKMNLVVFMLPTYLKTKLEHLRKKQGLAEHWYKIHYKGHAISENGRMYHAFNVKPTHLISFKELQSMFAKMETSTQRVIRIRNELVRALKR